MEFLDAGGTVQIVEILIILNEQRQQLTRGGNVHPEFLVLQILSHHSHSTSTTTCYRL